MFIRAIAFLLVIAPSQDLPWERGESGFPYKGVSALSKTMSAFAFPMS